MNKISKPQRELLDNVAAAGKRGLVCLPESSNARFEATLTALMQRNLLTCTERRGGGNCLRLTAEGEAAITPVEEASPVTIDEVVTPSVVNESGVQNPRGKLGIMTEMLRRPEGARVAQIQEATGWQAHSVRGAMSGALKKKLGLTIVSAVGEDGRIYRIVDAEPVA